MQNSRPLLPNPHQPGYNNLPPETALLAPRQATDTRSKRQRHDEKEWDATRELVTQLYYTHKLEDIIKIVKARTGFEAGLRQYKNKTAEWGLTKNLRKEQMEILLAKQEKRKRDQGRDTVWIVNGAKLDDSRLEHFSKRTSRNTADKASPSAPTPIGVEYYTPISLSDYNPTDPADMARSSPDVAHAPNAANTIKLLRSDIDQYDKDSRPVTVMRVEGLRYSGAIRDKPRLTHPFHQWGEKAALGNGRFADEVKLSRLLLQSFGVAKSLHTAWKDPCALPYVDLPHDPYALTEPPCYWIESQPPHDENDHNFKSILKFVQQGNFFQTLLGFTTPDRARWLSQWVIMDESIRAVATTASNHLFGDVVRSYTDNKIFSLLVNFRTSGMARNTLLLRLTIGEDPKGYVQDCDYCYSRFLILDIVGPEGAAKIHLSLRHHGMADAESFESLDNLKANVTLRPRRIHTKWSGLAFLCQGWSEAFVERRCTCGEIHDETQLSGHMVNMFKEEMSKDQWDPHASAFQEAAYQPFPLETKHTIVENADSDEGGSDTEVWDPEGTKGSKEVFEPYPETHDYSYDAVR